jgi:transposase-like protein
MEQRVFFRYSTAFKRQVVEDIESGRFASISAAREHYGIAGGSTIPQWLKNFGRNELLHKVVRVEKPDEKDQIRELKQQVKKLEQLLGRKEAEKVLAETQLEEACESMGISVEEFKKKHGIDVLRKLAGPEPGR